MELNIEKEHENKLFERKEIKANASYKAKTPTRAEVKEELCKKKNLDPEMVEIVSIDQEYGQKRCTITAYAYLTKEAKQRGAFKLSAKKKQAIAKAAEPAKKEAEPAREDAKPEEKSE
jgi:ribosomal protein S24E